MEFIKVKDFAKKHNLTERAVRKYCADGKIADVKLVKKTYFIPENALLPERKNAKKFSDNKILNYLKEEKDLKLKGGLYHKVQVSLTYNSNHIEGSKLSEDQTRFIFETNTIGINDKSVSIDDIVETTNHFKCIDYIIDNAKKTLSENIIKTLHKMLKNGTSDSQKKWFRVGDYKLRANEVGGEETCHPEKVSEEMKKLILKYNSKQNKKIADIIGFHYNFEKIHPFQDGNGRVGRLIMFKECLAHNIVPFIITEDKRWFYYRGLKEWKVEKNYLIETCMASQDEFKKWIEYFEI